MGILVVFGGFVLITAKLSRIQKWNSVSNACKNIKRATFKNSSQNSTEEPLHQNRKL